MRPVAGRLLWLGHANDFRDACAVRAGMSRSVAVAAAGVSLAEGRSLADAISTVVGTGPADVSPKLLAQLQQVLNGSPAL